ncbi:hypothetical protein AB5I41_20975 [Sphingomonas sp. MMS24-JH45]
MRESSRCASPGIVTSLCLLAAASPEPVTIASVRHGLAGTWAGKLEYRDYRAGRWFGIPVVTTIEAIGDGRTLVRKSVFDDGPKVGAVYITSIGCTGYQATNTGQSATFRAGRPVGAVETARLALRDARDATHWTLVEDSEGRDDDRPARIRETSVRNGATLTTKKGVEFSDDTGEAWLVRNRTALTRR